MPPKKEANALPEQPAQESSEATPEVSLETVKIVGPCGETPCGSTFGPRDDERD